MPSPFSAAKRVLAFCAALLAAETAQATISLQSTISYKETADGVSFSGFALNTGDQTAEDCVIRLETPFNDILTNVVGHLDPGVTNAWSLSYAHPDSASHGTFAAVIRTRYADPNGFPLHAVQIFPYALGDPAEARSPARIALSAPTRDIEGTALEDSEALQETAPVDGSVVCTLFLSPRPGVPQRPASLRIVLPDSLSCTSGERFAITPPYPATISLPITNLSALAGSRLSVSAILESSTEDGTPTATTATLQLPIGTTPPEFLHLVQEAPVRRPLPAFAPILALFLYLLLQCFRKKNPMRPTPSWDAMGFLSLLFTTILLAYELRLDLVAGSGLCLGGDTPAHHYLFSHLKESLAHGRIVSWAPGWWCGFPMYQYYFPLPYFAMVLLNVFLPSAIAFKFGLVLGIFLTPFCTYAAARLLRLPRPAPALLVLATLPLLLDTTHTMWGVNLSSSLAGMISNSWSFAFFPLALASVVRDTLDTRPRLRTIALLLAVLFSHFFTSIVLALLLLSVLPFLLISNKAIWRKALCAFLLDGLAPAFLMMWWLIPLVTTRPWSVDFGDPWTIHFWANLPVFAKLVIGPVAAWLVFAGLQRRWRTAEPARPLATALVLALLQIAISLFLFFFGYGMSKVFVNCRLWPFWIHGLLVLSALASASLLQRARHPSLGVVVYLLFAFAFAWDPPNYARSYSKWNFAGLEDRPEAPVYQDLVERLRGTPGRFSCDLHPYNERFGSTRAFEAMPALNGKPIIEGGIVNSALGSLVAYSVQGEVSDSPAGWPLRVIPKRMDVPTGLRHLELLGVRQFLARSSHVQKGIEADGAWSLIHDYGKWRLYENPSVDGSLVHAYPDGLPVVVTNDFQGAIIAWAQSPSLASTPQIVVSSSSATSETSAPPATSATSVTPETIPCPVRQSFNRLSFSTDHLGVPHLIAVSAFPNWRAVRGAAQIYNATPGFMVVFPTEHEVELVFGPTRADWLGRFFLLPGLGLLLCIAFSKRLRS